MTRKFGPVTTTITRVVEVTCDICGAAAPNATGTDHWSPSEGIDEIIRIEHTRSEHGMFSDDGGSGETYAPDICPSCFRTKVVPALKALGVNLDYKEFDF